MRLMVMALAWLVTSGCATLSTTLWLSGHTPAINENERVESVPQPGFTEELTLTLYATGKPVAAKKYGGKTRKTQPSLEIKPPQLVCNVTQTGTNVDHVAAYHYGARWKLATATMFVAEAIIAAIYILSEPPPDQSKLLRQLFGGYLAVDALVTAGMFFIPRRDVLQTRQRTVVTPVRSDCPAGLTLEIAGKRVEVDPHGKLDRLGIELLDKTMADPAGVIRARYGKYEVNLIASSRQRCDWLRDRRLPSAADACQQQLVSDPRGPIKATLQVTPGDLTGERRPSIEHRLNVYLTSKTR